MHSFSPLVLLVLSVSCADNAGSKPLPVSAARDAGWKDAANEAAPDASIAPEDAAPTRANDDASTPVAEPEIAQPVEACGEDLNVVSGIVKPALGGLPKGKLSSSNLTEAGPYAVIEREVEIAIPGGKFEKGTLQIEIESGILQGTIYAPSQDGKGMLDTKMPLVLVLPGFTISYTYYASYARHFASYGFAVLGVDTRSNLLAASHDSEALEISQTLDWALSKDSPYAGKLDPDKVALSGHSKGGKLAFFAAVIDPRVDLVIAWDPSNAGGPPCFISSDCHRQPVAPNCAVGESGLVHQIHAETLIFGAPPTSANPEETHNAKHFYRGAPSPAALVQFDTDHFAWADRLGKPEIQAVTRATQIAVLLDRFAGVPGLEDLQPGGTSLLRADKVIAVLTK